MSVPMRFAKASDGVSIAYALRPGREPARVGAWALGTPPIALKPRIPAYVNTSRELDGDGRAGLTFDWRGTGQSDPQPPRSLDELVLDLEAITDALDEPPDVWAGGIACFPVVTYAASHPGKWRSLLLGDPSVVFERNQQAFLNRPGWEEDYHSHLLAIARTNWTTIRQPELDGIVDEWARGVPAATLAAYLAVAATADLTDLLPRLDLPVLVTGRLPAREVAALIPNAIMLQPTPQLVGEPGRGMWDAWDEYIAPLVGERRAPSTNGLLTKRETEILRALVSGPSNAEIAAGLGLSPRTVDRHVANIFKKIGARNRAEAVAWAFRHGLGE